MGPCSSTASEGGLVRHQEISPLLVETSTHNKASGMSEGRRKTDFNHFLEVNNTMVKMAREKFEHNDELWREYSELKKLNEEITTENESLRQRYVTVFFRTFSMCKINFKRNDDKRDVNRLENLLSIRSLIEFVQVLSYFSNHRMNNDSEMNHRGYQSHSEDVTSRNKRSDVLKKYEGMDGTKRKHAIEAFGSNRTDRTELWFRKDLTCRIFVVFIYQSINYN